MISASQAQDIKSRYNALRSFLGDRRSKISVRPAIKAFGAVIGKHAAHDPFKPMR